MIGNPFISIARSRFFWPAWVSGLGLAGAAARAAGSTGQTSPPLSVRVQVEPRRHYVGQGIEIAVGVVAADRRPRVDVPRLTGARIVAVGTEFRPISNSGIGSLVAQENVFVTRYRVVPSRPGVLEIPPFAAHLDDRSGRSRPIRLTIDRVPVAGRPPEYLGGVGTFTVQAEASPNVVRLGQELEFRVKISGPAAWGSLAGPDLRRLERLALGPVIEDRPSEMTDEPPSRTFVYRLRPQRAGEAVLPPVAIASFDPVLGRFITRVTSGVPIRAVAVPVLDPTTVELTAPLLSSDSCDRVANVVTVLSAGAILGLFLCLVQVRRRIRRARSRDPGAARHYAARLARSFNAERLRNGRLKSSVLVYHLAPSLSGPISSSPCRDAAHRITQGMIRYLELGAGRPPGALTPDEAREFLTELTGHAELGDQAGQLAERCDLALYGDARVWRDTFELLESARRLFEALGRLKLSRDRGSQES
jgi:hypothetical protein